MHLRTLNETKTALTQQLEQLRVTSEAEKQAWEQERSGLREQVEALKVSCATVDPTVKVMQKDYAYLKEYVTQLEESVELGAQREAALEAQVKALDSQAGQGDAMEQLKQVHAQELANLEQTMAQLRIEAESSKSGDGDKIKAVMADLGRYKMENNKLKAQVKELESRVASQSDNAQAQNAWESKYDALAAEHQQLQEQLTQVTREAKEQDQTTAQKLAEAQNREEQLHEEIAKTKALLETSQASASQSIKDQLQALHHENAALQNRMGPLEAERDEATEQLGYITQERDELLRALNDMRERSEATLAALREEMDTKLNDMATMHEDELRLVQAQYTDAAAKEKQALEEARTSVQSLQQHIEQLKQELATSVAQANASTTRYEEELARMARSLGEEDGRLVELTQECARLSNDLSAAQAEAKAKVTEVEQLLREKASLEAKLQQEVNNGKDYADAIEALENQVTRAQSELSQAKASGENALKSLIQSLVTTLSTLSRGEHLSIVEGIPPELETALTQLKESLTAKAKFEESNSAELQRVSAEHAAAIASLQSELQLVRDQSDKLNADKQLLMEKLKTMKNTVGPALQAEMEESKRLRGVVEAMTSEKQQLEQQLLALNQELEENRQAIGSAQGRLQDDLDAANEAHEKTQRELERLRQHLLEAEETQTQEMMRQENLVNEYRMQISNLEAEREQWESMASADRSLVVALEKQIEELKDERDSAKLDLDRVQAEAQQTTVSLANLQEVLQQFQQSKEADIQFATEAMKRQLATTTASLEEFKARALEAEGLVNSAQDAQSQLVKLQEEATEKNNTIGKLRHDVIQLQTHLSEAMKMMKGMSGSDENVDRRVIANLVVTYCSLGFRDSKRNDVLKVIASLLKFSDDEKARVGLTRRPSWTYREGPTSPTGLAPASVEAENFSDMWIAFLLKETSQVESPKASSGKQV